MVPPTLLAVPNVSEGRDGEAIAAIGRAFVEGEQARETGTWGGGASGSATAGEGDWGTRSATPSARQGESGDVRLLDVHRDPDHHRSVFTLAGRQGEIGWALLAGARAAVERIDVMSRGSRAGSDGGPGVHTPQREGQHPYVGTVDVVPLVYLHAQDRGAACAEALVVADRIGEELGVPVFLYGELTGGDRTSRRTRAELRRGGVDGLAARMAREGAARETELRPDFGPPRMHPRAGATLVAARGPLVAFNLQLAAPATVKDAEAVAALIREGGAEGLPGVRAIGVELGGVVPQVAGISHASAEREARGDAAEGEAVAQVSMNIERPLEVSLAMLVEAVERHARIASAELVGLAPRAALEGFPEDVPLLGFDAKRHVIENALGL
jgi:glutamate formiminotransferase / 5-formyltetrahydrofolate cyclo-ligase